MIEALNQKQSIHENHERHEMKAHLLTPYFVSFVPFVDNLFCKLK